MYLPEFLLFFCKGKTIREKSVYFLQLKKAINSAEFLTHFVMTVVQIFVQKKSVGKTEKTNGSITFLVGREILRKNLMAICRLWLFSNFLVRFHLVQFVIVLSSQPFYDLQ